MTKRAVLYGRVSSNDKAKTDGANLQAQIDLCREYAIKQGYTIIAELTEDDRGASGATFDLPQLSRAMDMARSGEYEVFICRELDRLARNIAKQFLVEEELKRAGVRIEYGLYDFAPTPEGQLQKSIYAAFGEFERTKIQERMTRGKQRELRKGNSGAGGGQMLGYVTVRDAGGSVKYQIDEEEARVVRFIFELYAYGDDGKPLSYRAICERLTAMGIPKPKAQDGPWNHSTVRSILRNEAYTGKWMYGRTRMVDKNRVDVPPEEWIEMEMPVIIDRELWKAVRARLESNKKLAHNRARYDYLLSGRTACAICGYSYNATSTIGGARNKHRHYYYRHNCDAPKDASCEAKGLFIVKDTDKAVWNWLCEKFKDEEALLRAIEEEQEEREKQLVPRRQELESANELVAKNERGLARVRKLFYDEHLTEEEYHRDARPYQDAIASLEREKTRLQALIIHQQLTNETKRTIMGLAQDVRKGIAKAHDDFEKRKRMIEMLQVQCRMEIRDGVKLVHIECIVGAGVVSCDQSVSTNCTQLQTIPYLLTGTIVLSIPPTRKV